MDIWIVKNQEGEEVYRSTSREACVKKAKSLAHEETEFKIFEVIKISDIDNVN